MSKSPLAALSAKQLNKAAGVQERIERLQAQLEEILGAAAAESATSSAGGKDVDKPAGKRGRRRMSRAARARISAGMKARWAKRKAAKKGKV